MKRGLQHLAKDTFQIMRGPSPREKLPSLVAGLLVLWLGVFFWELFDIAGILFPTSPLPVRLERAVVESAFVFVLGGMAVAAAWITSKKRSPDTSAEEMYSRAFIKTSPSFFVAIDRSGRTLMMNEAMLEALSYAREEVIGTDYLSRFVPPREHDVVSAVFQELISRGGPTKSQNHVLAKDGREVLVQWSGRAFSRESGELDFFFGAGIDITEHKKAQDALAASERRYRLYAENVRDVLWVMDNDLKYVYISPSVELLRGYTVEEALSMPMEKVFTPESFRRLIKTSAEIKTRLAKGETYDPKASLTFELEQYCKDGSTRWTEVIASLFRDDSGRHVGFLGITRDITDRKRAQESLRLSEERYRTIFETTGNATIIAREDTVISLANSEFEKLSGFPRKEIEGNRSLQDFVVAEDLPRMEGYHRARMQDPDSAPRNYDFRFRDRAGRIKDVSATATIIPGTKMSVVSLLDITERKHAEEHLKLSRERLRNLHKHTQDLREQERSRVAREIHDELGQVLTALKMDLSFLNHRLPKDQTSLHAKVMSMTRSIDASIDSVRRIIMDLRPGLLDHLGLVPAIEWQAGEFQKRTGISCTLNIPAQEIHLDREISTSIFRIFQEALTNIARHAQATGVDISLCLADDRLTLSIHDNGRGITKNQIDNPKSFGLMGMRERTLFCNGTFDIFTEVSGGTTVVVDIPLVDERTVDDTGSGGR